MPAGARPTHRFHVLGCLPGRTFGGHVTTRQACCVLLAKQQRSFQNLMPQHTEPSVWFFWRRYRRRQPARSWQTLGACVLSPPKLNPTPFRKTCTPGAADQLNGWKAGNHRLARCKGNRGELTSAPTSVLGTLSNSRWRSMCEGSLAPVQSTQRRAGPQQRSLGGAAQGPLSSRRQYRNGAGCGPHLSPDGHGVHDAAALGNTHRTACGRQTGEARAALLAGGPVSPRPAHLHPQQRPSLWQP